MAIIDSSSDKTNQTQYVCCISWWIIFDRIASSYDPWSGKYIQIETKTRNESDYLKSKNWEQIIYIAAYLF